MLVSLVVLTQLFEIDNAPSNNAPPVFPVPEPHGHATSTSASQRPAFGTNSFTPFAFNAPPSVPNTWTPFTSPLKSSTLDEPEIADVSMDTARSATPSPRKADESSPLARKLRRKRSAGGGGELVLSSPIRRAYKSREKDRDRERERAYDRKRGLLVDEDSEDDDGEVSD